MFGIFPPHELVFVLAPLCLFALGRCQTVELGLVSGNWLLFPASGPTSAPHIDDSKRKPQPGVCSGVGFMERGVYGFHRPRGKWAKPQDPFQVPLTKGLPFWCFPRPCWFLHFLAGSHQETRKGKHIHPALFAGVPEPINANRSIPNTGSRSFPIYLLPQQVFSPTVLSLPKWDLFLEIVSPSNGNPP